MSETNKDTMMELANKLALAENICRESRTCPLNCPYANNDDCQQRQSVDGIELAKMVLKEMEDDEK